MKYFGFRNGFTVEHEGLPRDYDSFSQWIFFCRPHEIRDLQKAFELDESTIKDIANLDDSVRYNCFDGYDFISLVHIEIQDESILMHEINIYASGNFFILVVPEESSPIQSEMENKLRSYASSIKRKDGMIPFIYYQTLHNLLVDFSDTLEALEDRMEALLGEIVEKARAEQFSQINNLRSIAFAAKKHLRGLSYIGDQILIDDNGLLCKKSRNYFRNISTRFNKLYDFADSLYTLSGEIIHSFDSRLTMKTNETVNKLTALTLFFGPLTVITGIYGMNFERMPELAWRFGYPMVILGMICVSAGIYFIMKVKKWL